MPKQIRLSFLVCSFLLSAISNVDAQSHKPWTVHDIYYGKVDGAASPKETEFSPDGHYLSYRTLDGALGAIDTETGKRTILTPAAKLRDIAKRPHQ